jgi:RNA polymerase sigma-32 factor
MRRQLAISDDTGLSHYLRHIRQFPMLQPQDEYALAKRWREHNDGTAVQALVTSHLRLVAKIASRYRSYGVPMSEVISEGNIGLMQAVKRFDPERGFRLTTYAMWWIKSAIHQHILRSWSVVRLGTTANQKKLFFNLRKAKRRLSALEEGDMRPEHVVCHRQRSQRHRAGCGRYESPPQRRRVAEFTHSCGRRSGRMAGLVDR